MEKNEQYEPSYPTVGKYMGLLTCPVSDWIRNINDRCLDLFGRESLTWYGFLTVVRKLTNETLYIKLYYVESKIGRSKREIEDFASAFYHAELPNLNYTSCNIMNIPLKMGADPGLIWLCNSMEELETGILSGMDKNSWIGINESAQEGGLTIGGKASVSEYRRWKQMLQEGYLEPDYEEKISNQQKHNDTGTNLPGNVKFAVQDKPGTLQIQVFPKTGGPQPESLDPDTINHFFKGNHAKIWAMVKGFLSTFHSYENGVICFDIISDPRYKGDDMVLSKFIASEYKTHVDLLKSAVKYEARHFYAKDIIGYVANTDDPQKLIEYEERTRRSYAGLSSVPDCIHHGVI